MNTWGHHWPRKKLLVHCDNQAVVDIWKKGTKDHPQIMALVRMLYFCAARHNIHVIIAHIDGTPKVSMNTDNFFLFTVSCENPRWPPQPKNVILAYTYIDVTNTVHSMNIWVIL